MPNSTPPSAGLATLMAPSRPVTTATAVGSWLVGTTARNAPACAAEKTAAPAPSTNATSGIAQ